MKKFFSSSQIFSLFLIIFLPFSNLLPNEYIVTGRLISKTTAEPIEYANIMVEFSDIGTASASNGEFQIRCPSLPAVLVISHIGYKTLKIKVDQSSVGTIYLIPKVLKGEEVYVSATRATKGETPVAFSTLTKEEIETRYSVEDVPMVLSLEPGVYAYSESGNGTGYSYISIRGFDQSRISVMIDNVPLNDNESHQVYWVDHGDILANAQDVQIQRGVGNSLYGSSAFGGSVNVITEISSNEPQLGVSFGLGSFNTNKVRANFSSGKLFGDKVSFTSRVSQIQSNGYREYHKSIQRSGFFGIEYKNKGITNQLRALIGYENTNLAWDGVPAEFINDREQRRKGYKAYTDDFFQQVYSLNTKYQITEELFLSNVLYLVKGEGYYENYAECEDYYSYNLDIYDQYPDTVEQDLTTDFLRRRWIVNTYYGVVPTLTVINQRLRMDIGGEFRSYTGDHFGEVKNFSVSTLNEIFGNKWYKYYQYEGKKIPVAAFMHFSYKILPQWKMIADIQYQNIEWNLDQRKIGHAAGHNISANWEFLNPRLGTLYTISDGLSIFFNYGRAQKEPADDQIIEADDVWSEPVMVAAEVLDDYELGLDFNLRSLKASFNAYWINYDNEQLKNIDIEQEGEYDYYSADKTLHRGVEFDFNFIVNPELRLNLSGSLSEHKFITGENEGNFIPNVPSLLLNGSVKIIPIENLNIFANFRYVGKQYIDDYNIGKIEPYLLTDVGSYFKWKFLLLTFKVNNVFDILYSTYGYGYEWDGYHAYYWPGATRNYFISISFNL